MRFLKVTLISFLLLILMSILVWSGEVQSEDEINHIYIPLSEEVANKIIRISNDPVTKMYYENILLTRYKYLNYFKSVFKKHGIPQELVYLSVIESGINPRAKSPVAAYGIWQFMKPTAESLGLRINFWIDERSDYRKSTEAAAKYLRSLYRSFKSWEFAIAGYNVGGTKLKTALRNKEGIRDIQNLPIPTETKNFVIAVYAIYHIFENPEAFGFEKPNKKEKFSFDLVEFDTVVDLKFIAYHAGLPLEVIKKMNPELKFEFTPPHNYMLKLPRGKARILNKSLEAHGLKPRILKEDIIIVHRESLIRFYQDFEVYKPFFYLITENKKIFFRRNSIIISLDDEYPPCLEQHEIVPKDFSEDDFTRETKIYHFDYRENPLSTNIYLFFNN